MRAKLLLAAVLAAGVSSQAGAWTCCLMDPVTTYTNGMALPSTDPMRSHNVYWKCDPYRRGCCGNCYHYVWAKHAIFPNKCGRDCRGPVCEDCSHRAGSFEGVEAAGVVNLGQLPAPNYAAAGAATPPRR